MLKPTIQEYGEFQQAYEFFNCELFNGKLPNCLITLQRKYGVLGYFARERWSNKDGELTDEIAMNPRYFGGQTLEAIMQTLVHEMVHLWQKHFGEPGRARYHNKKWASKMESIGLMPSSTGEPGGKRTGDHISDYIIEDGLFSKACKRLVANGFSISWIEEDWKQISKEENGSNRKKYTCPTCYIKAWGRPGLSLICGKCKRQLI